MERLYEVTQNKRHFHIGVHEGWHIHATISSGLTTVKILNKRRIGFNNTGKAIKYVAGIKW